jgi:hypothetical protein
MVGGILVVLTLRGGFEQIRGRSLKVRKLYWGIGWAIVAHRREKMIVVVSRRECCSMLAWEEVCRQKYPGRAEVPVGVLAKMGAAH